MKSDIRNRWRRLNNFYKIIDKKGKSIVFKLNKAQEYIYDIEKLHKRIIILKARQLGMSTYKLIDGLDRCLFYKNQTVVITAHKLDKQKELFQKVKYAFSCIPTKIHLQDDTIRQKPTPKYDSVNELYFPHNNSRVRVSLDSRSGTPTSLHITELAFRQDARAMMSGTLPSVPKDAPITIETTANGIGNYFYELRQKNYNKVGGFYVVFLPRYTDSKYIVESSDDFKLPLELLHLDKLDITKDQKYWYYLQWLDLDKDVFQEFPSIPEEAFISTGRPVIRTQIVKELPELGYDKDDIFSELWIYKKPNKNEVYSMGVDTAEGGIDGDYSTITVRDKELDLVACYYGHIPPDELTKVIDRLYTLGYTAPSKLGIERNNTGIATLTKAKDFYWYRDLYSEKTVDRISQKSTKKYGRHTNLKTRPIMISEYEEAIRTGLITQVDERIISELYTFVYNEKNISEALEGTHDDGMFSDMICLQMHKVRQRIIINKK